MEILFIILAVIAAIVAIILLLPVDIIIKSDDKGEMAFRYKFLFKEYGENPNPNNPILKAVKKSTGIDKLEIKEIQKKLKESSYVPTALETLDILKGLLKEIGHILKHFSTKRFELNIKISAEDAADAAISYGQYCALVYPLTAGYGVFIKTPKRVRKINIGISPEVAKDEITYHIVIRIRLLCALAAVFRISYKETMRNLENEEPKKPQGKRKKPSKKA